MGAVSCKNRSFNTPARGLSAASSAGPVSSPFSDTTLVDLSLLNDDAPATEEPEADYLSSAFITFLDSNYNSMIKKDGTFVGWERQSSFRHIAGSLLDYEALLEAAKVKTVVPKKFAAASVLEVLRRNREEFALNTEGGKNRRNAPALGIKLLMPSGVVKDSQGSIFYIHDSTRPFSQTKCGVNLMVYMNPVKWHYMCATPGVFRACTRFNVGMYSEFIEKKYPRGTTMTDDEKTNVIRDIAKNDLDYAIKFCRNPTEFDASHPELKGVFSVDERYPEIFQRFYAKQVVNGINMFDYIMRSPIYAFDFKQQQAVLNTYYGLMKPKGSGGFDPSNQKECEKYREAAGDERNGLNYCLPETPRLVRFVSGGR